ncbi:MAG: MurR/RpiR family transcriptional regulator [Atopobiaceae bacterium]|nr:MurR/RpiR family transcriptional regulator [Atopobiaceae bacterium]
MTHDEDRALAFAEKASRGMPGSIKSVADLLLGEGTGICDLTMAQIAARAYTSKPTLVRFAKQAGYAGWRDYRQDFLRASERIEAERARQADVNVNYPFGDGASVREVADKIARIQTLAASEVEAHMDYDALGGAAAAILGANRVVVLGAQHNRDRGRVLAKNLDSIGILCHVPNTDEAGPLTLCLAPHDCVVAISYSGSLSHPPMVFVPGLKDKGVTTIAVTNGERSALGAIANHTLAFPPLEHYHNKIGAFYSGACTSLILDLLYASCYAQQYAHRRGVRERTVSGMRGIMPDDFS